MKKIIIAMAILFTSTINAQSTYTLDKNHAKLIFSVKHFGISDVEGRFKGFTATLEAKKEDFTDALIEMIADVKSIDTDIEMRDNDLKSDNWFDAEKYPTITFKSTSFKNIRRNNYVLKGNITIHGITKPISLDVVYNGKSMNPMSKKYSVGFTVTGKLNRNDFQVGTGPSSISASNEVELRSSVEFIIEDSGTTAK